MRVIAGEFRSRRLKSMPGLDVRPTPDRLREALFNILAPRIEGAVFVDAYAGTGAVGIEAISRGASRAVFIERKRTAAELIRENVASLGILDRCQIIQGPASLYLPRQQADIVFLDPPYDLAQEYDACLGVLGGSPPPIVVVQHDAKQAVAERYGTMERLRT